MFGSVTRVLLAALFAVLAVPAIAADLYEPPVYEAPPVQEVVYEDFGGWYIRGDIDYHFSKFKGAEYITYGTCCGVDPGTNSFDFGKLKGALSLGAGVGYQISKHLRADLTFDYMFKSDFRGQTTGTNGVSVDTSAYSAMLLLANVYADLGTWQGFTPYVGAGIGGAYVQWDNLRNTIGGITTEHVGSKNWRFAYAAMVGTSYCLTDRLKLDVGYRYSRINGGRMFELARAGGTGTGPGFDRGFDIHEGRAGLRYQFSGNSGCGAEPVPYEPAPEPIYTK